MRVAITGASGLVGTALTARLRERGHQVIPVSRRALPGGIVWDPSRQRVDSRALEGLDAVVHLAGEGMADRRWTDRRKEALRTSRVKVTSFLARTLATLHHRPEVLVSMSAVGIYGDRGDTILDESSTLGDGFLAELGRDWEAAADPAREVRIRVVHPRMGIVLTRTGGALQRMLTPFRLGLGGKLGDGTQWWSWITLDDALGGLERMLVDRSFEGPINLTAPEPVTNAHFAAALATLLGRPSFFTVPRGALEFLLGEMASTMLLASQRVLPRRLEAAGFWFAYPTLAEGLRRAVAG